MRRSRPLPAAFLALALSAGASLPALAQADGAPAPSMLPPVQLVQGAQIGKPAFAMGDTDSGGHGQPVDGIQGSSGEMLALHVHAHLALFYKGEQIAVPAGIGIVKPFKEVSGFVGQGRGYYWLHTHDATGIIHVESPDYRPYALGNLFDIWGEPLTAHRVAGLIGKVHAFIDGKPYRGEARDIPIRAHSQITLEVGEPVVPPPVYIFPQGL